MTKMYDRYLNKVKTCRYQLSYTSGEDAAMDGAAFDAQQALEFIIKFITGEYGVPCNKTHDIANLYSNLKDKTGFTFDEENALFGLANTISDWEHKSRYGNGALTNRVMVEKCLELAESIDKKWRESTASITFKNNSKVSDLLSKAEGN